MDYAEQLWRLWLELASVVKQQGETLVLLRELGERVAAVERSSCATAFDAVNGA